MPGTREEVMEIQLVDIATLVNSNKFNYANSTMKILDVDSQSGQSQTHVSLREIVKMSVMSRTIPKYVVT